MTTVTPVTQVPTEHELGGEVMADMVAEPTEGPVPGDLGRRYVIVHTMPDGGVELLGATVYEGEAGRRCADGRVEERRSTAAANGWTDRYDVYELVPVVPDTRTDPPGPEGGDAALSAEALAAHLCSLDGCRPAPCPDHLTAAGTALKWIGNQRTDPPTSASRAGGLPTLHPDAVVVLDGPNGHEEWTGAEWNDFAAAAKRNRELVAYRFVEIHEPPPAGSGGSVDGDAPPTTANLATTSHGLAVGDAPQIPDEAIVAYRNAARAAMDASLGTGSIRAYESIRAGLVAAYAYLAAAALRAYADAAHPRPEGIAQRTDYGTGIEYDPVCVGCNASWNTDENGCTERVEILRAAYALVTPPICNCHETGAPCDCADKVPPGVSSCSGTGTPREANDHGVRYDEITVGRWVRLEGYDGHVTALVTRMDTQTCGRARVFPEHQQGEPYGALFHADNVIAVVAEPGTGTPPALINIKHPPRQPSECTSPLDEDEPDHG